MKINKFIIVLTIASIFILLGAIFTFAPKVKAFNNSLTIVDELDLGYYRGEVIVVHDKERHTDCYLYRKSGIRSGGSIFCQPAK